MLANFAMVIKLFPFWEPDKTNSFFISFFLIIITKKILGKNVAFTNFVGRIAIVIVIR
jgi:hypothetical protein